MYDEFVKNLREKAGAFDYDGRPDIACDYEQAADAIEELSKRPEIPETGIGDLSDGYHTFNGLYYQRMILFAVLVKAYKSKAWKS